MEGSGFSPARRSGSRTTSVASSTTSVCAGRSAPAAASMRCAIIRWRTSTGSRRCSGFRRSRRSESPLPPMPIGKGRAPGRRPRYRDPLQMRPTLLSVNNYYYPRGGAEIVFLRHNDMLAELGWNVVPFCMRHPRNRPTPWDVHFAEEIEIGRDYPLGQKLRKGLKSLYSFEARAKVDALIRLVSPDVCHAHNVYHHLSPSVLAAVKRSGVPLVVTLHDLKLACPAYSMLSRGEVCERCRNGGLFHVALRRCMKGSLPISVL